MSKLKRSLTLSSVVMFGLAYMTPIIVLGTFGIMADSTHGVVAGAYALALLAMLMTAYSYGLMAAEYPVAGSAYTYARKSISPKLGFLVGWAVLLDYLFLPMVIWLFGAVYLNSAFPHVPMSVWILSFIGVTTVINILGIKFANTVNYLMMLIQMLVLIAFVLLAMHYVFGDASKSLFDLAPFYQPKVQMSLVMAGAAIACYSFLGFDAVTTLTEETINPKKVIPRAILLITLLGGGIFIATSYFVGLAHPGFVFQSSDAAASEIAKNIGGDIFVTIFLIGLIIGQFASGLSAQASASRLLYAMGRDGVLPKCIFGKLHARFQTPALNIVLCGLVALLALAMDVTTSVSFINFGAFLAFTSVNLSVIARFYIRRTEPAPRDFLKFLLIPILGAAADLWLLISLDQKAITLGLSWLVIGLVYLAYLTKGFSKEPPEMDFTEAE
ncbi:APC family permease [Leeia oryzae]|uniref:APC family permease n=1 Tax=Leeia oryzae TaxID=356662 RepID=UPI000477BEBD|nr:APC family permease [Leeia oryzae]